MSRPWIAGAVGTALLTVAVLWALAFHRLIPPRNVVMATGPQGGAYSSFGPRYREALARAGVELRLLETAGAVENLVRLRDPRSEVSVGFLHAGAASAGDSSELVSLGSVFFEPLWLFYRGRASAVDIRDLPGRRFSIGPEGSATRQMTLRLLALDGADPSRFDLLPLTPEQAGESLLRGDIDACAMVTSFDAPVVRRLLADPDVTVASFRRADAWLALDPHLDKLVLPEGVGDPARNLPPKEVVLLATKASLVVRRDLDPALQYLLLEAASEIHAPAGVFHRAGRFPSPEAADVPLSRYASQFYKTGVPWLQRHLPFWLAVLGERFLLLLIPLLGVAYPLLRVLPPLYQWSMSSKIFRLYGELKALEAEMEKEETGASGDALRARLDELERRANHIRIPGTFSPLLYNFRGHLDLVRSRLRTSAGRVPPV
jgi:TRAP-type uncharacterized transport system substrate-binding protein